MKIPNKQTNKKMQIIRAINHLQFLLQLLLLPTTPTESSQYRVCKQPPTQDTFKNTWSATEWNKM